MTIFRPLFENQIFDEFILFLHSHQFREKFTSILLLKIGKNCFNCIFILFFKLNHIFFYFFLRNSHDAFIMSSIIESLTVGTNNEDSFEKIAEILSDGAGSASNSVEYALDQIRSNIKWVQNHEKSVCQFLNSNY